MKTTTLTPCSNSNDDVGVSIASGVACLLDANDRLERRLIEAAKTVSTSHRIEVRAIGETLYRLLDTLNSRLEPFCDPATIAKPGAKMELRNQVIRAEHNVSRKSNPLRKIQSLSDLHRFQDEWTETYLDFASQLGRALEPAKSGSGVAFVELSAA